MGKRKPLPLLNTVLNLYCWHQTESGKQFGAVVNAIRTLCVLFLGKNWRWEFRGHHSLSVCNCKAVKFSLAQRLRAQENSFSGFVQRPETSKIYMLHLFCHITVLWRLCMQSAFASERQPRRRNPRMFRYHLLCAFMLRWLSGAESQRPQDWGALWDSCHSHNWWDT